MAAANPLGSTVRDFREPREHVLRLDPLLLLAAVGLIAASVYTLAGATQDDIEGQPLYYVYRQAAYGGVGLVLMLLLSRLDYSRVREWKAGIYVLMIGTIVLVYGIGATARGSKRAIELGFINFQSRSEERRVGKECRSRWSPYH